MNIALTPQIAQGVAMSRRPITHLVVDPPRRSPSAAIARAYLRAVAGDARKRIDDYIDYFGSGGERRSVVASGPRGRSLLDVDGAR